ncbi:hypothetical protein PG994_008630 [Apiospora phragmitis]|uniref:Uncharacterized protein n=1 Tax=Apiospora phragmitis TaxID=2905665 RepID=A0ABR1UH14_9PEZI
MCPTVSWPGSYKFIASVVYKAFEKSCSNQDKRAASNALATFKTNVDKAADDENSRVELLADRVLISLQKATAQELENLFDYLHNHSASVEHYHFVMERFPEMLRALIQETMTECEEGEHLTMEESYDFMTKRLLEKLEALINKFKFDFKEGEDTGEESQTDDTAHPPESS